MSFCYFGIIARASYLAEDVLYLRAIILLFSNCKHRLHFCLTTTATILQKYLGISSLHCLQIQHLHIREFYLCTCCILMKRIQDKAHCFNQIVELQQNETIQRVSKECLKLMLMCVLALIVMTTNTD